MSVSDSARDFWDRISPRERRLVVVLGVCAPIIIAIWLGLSIRDGLVDMETRNERTRKALRALDGMRADGVPQQKGDDVVSMMGTEALSLPTSLDTAAKAAGFTLKTTSPHPSQTRNGFVTNSVSVTLEDLSIEQLKTFLSTVETNSKVVMVTHIDLRRDFRDKAKLDVNLEVSTYSKEPPAKGEGSGAGSAAVKKGS
jgi:type II secretory pathway component PulM